MAAVTWPGAFNLADLGGLATNDGHVTAFGRVYRSGLREYVTDAGWAAARASGLSTIIDLRSPDEIGRRPHHPIVDETYVSAVTLVHAPTEDADNAEFQRLCGPYLSHPRYYTDNVALWPEKFAVAFRGIAEASGAVLIHCSAGRDRTGMICAMLLKLNDVTVAAIADDYGAAVLRVNEHMRASPHPREPHYDSDELESRVTERRAAIETWIDGFDVRGYLHDAGVTTAELDRLSAVLR